MSSSVSQLELTKPLETHPPVVDYYSQAELVIRPRRGWIPVDWKELWTHRELLYFLVDTVLDRSPLALPEIESLPLVQLST